MFSINFKRTYNRWFDYIDMFQDILDHRAGQKEIGSADSLYPVFVSSRSDRIEYIGEGNTFSMIIGDTFPSYSGEVDQAVFINWIAERHPEFASVTGYPIRGCRRVPSELTQLLHVDKNFVREVVNDILKLKFVRFSTDGGDSTEARLVGLDKENARGVLDSRFLTYKMLEGVMLLNAFENALKDERFPDRLRPHKLVVESLEASVGGFFNNLRMVPFPKAAKYMTGCSKAYAIPILPKLNCIDKAVFKDRGGFWSSMRFLPAFFVREDTSRRGSTVWSLHFHAGSWAYEDEYPMEVLARGRGTALSAEKVILDKVRAWVTDWSMGEEGALGRDLTRLFGENAAQYKIFKTAPMSLEEQLHVLHRAKARYMEHLLVTAFRMYKPLGYATFTPRWRTAAYDTKPVYDLFLKVAGEDFERGFRDKAELWDAECIRPDGSLLSPKDLVKED